MMLNSVHPQTAAFVGNQFHAETEPANIATSNSEHEDKVENNRQVRTSPGQQEVGSDGRKKDSFELTQEAEEIRKMQIRDQEVRAHEAAHAAAGGGYAGSPSYTFEKGPDGQSYAVAGEVSIDISPIPGDPEGTLQKAQQVRAAALAPAEPSAQDMKVAQRAQAMATEARMEIAEEQSEGLADIVTNNSAAESSTAPVENESMVPSEANKTEPNISRNNIASGFARLSVRA